MYNLLVVKSRVFRKRSQFTLPFLTGPACFLLHKCHERRSTVDVKFMKMNQFAFV